MKKLALFALAFGIAAPLATLTPAGAASTVPVPFTVLAASSQSGYPIAPSDKVIVRKRMYDIVWSQHGGTPANQPPVDFATDMVVASFMGFQPTSGYSFSVSSVTTDGAKVDVFLDDISPGPNCAVLFVITSPAIFVKIPKLGLPVFVHHNGVVTNCP